MLCCWWLSYKWCRIVVLCCCEETYRKSMVPCVTLWFPLFILTSQLTLLVSKIALTLCTTDHFLHNYLFLKKESVRTTKAVLDFVVCMSTSCLDWLQLKHGDLKVSSTQLIYTVLCKDQMAAWVTTKNPWKEFLISHFYLKCLLLDQT